MEDTRPTPPIMATLANLEARVRAVETVLHALHGDLVTLQSAPNWLDEIIGSCRDEPAFDDVMALGRAFRASQPYPEESGASA